jgi:GNAT superfamily N-acetyltransferase
VISVRAAQPADEPSLIDLTERLAAFDLPPWRSAGEIARADHSILRDALHAPREDAAILVAEHAGAVLGCVFATTRLDYFTQAPHAHVEVLAVHQRAEGRGAGRLLMQAIEAWSRGRGHAFITLNVFHRNAHARGLYEHLGYEPETVHYRKSLG